MRNPLLHSNEPSRMNRLIAKCREGLNSCAQRLGSREPLRFWAIAGAVLCLSLAGCFSLAHLAQRGSAKKEAKVTIAAVTAPAASLQSASSLAQPKNKAPQEVTPKKTAVAKPAVANNQPAPAPAQQVAPAQIPLRPLVLAPPTISDAKLDGEKEDGDISRKRESWFFDQRAYPNKHIPAGAYQKALEQRDAMKAAQRSASSSGTNSDSILITFPGDALWHLTGPQPINNPFGMNGGFPTASGRITAIAVDNTDATGNTVYVGGAAGGVWKTTNGGTTWTPLTDSQPSLAVGSITIDPNNSQTIYVGTGEENFNLDAFYGAGILKSTNGGTSWTQLGASTFAQALGPDTGGAYIGQIAVQPGNPNIVLAAVSYILNGTVGGIYRSTDGGTTWTEDTSPQGLGATSVFFESTSNAGTNATAWMAMGDPFGVTSVNGIYKSTDSGATWTLQTGGLPTTSLGRIILGYAPSTSGAGATVYAAIATSASNNNSSDLLGFFKTVNGGTSWTSITGPDGGTFGFCNHQCFYDMAIGVDPANASVVVIGGGPYSDNFTSLFESKDGGSTWTPSSSSGNPVAGNFANGSTTTHVHVDTHAIVFNASGSLLYVGDDGGIWSTNTPTPSAGTSPTWSDLNASLAITQFYPGPSSAVSDDNYGFGGTQDNDTELFQNSLTWQNEFICGDGGFTAIDQSTPTTIWAACNVTAGTKVKKAVFNGQFITVGVGGPSIPGFDVAETVITGSGDAMEFIPPLALDDNTPDNLYFGSCRVWWANNAASSLANTFIPLTPNWTAVSGDLTTPANANSPSTCTVQGTGITNLEVAHSNDSVVVAGTSNGKIWETQEAGVAFPPPALPTWNELDTSALPGRTVTAVRTQRNDSTGAIVYATFSGFGHCTGCDLKGHVFKTTNATTIPPTWTDISGDLPDIPVNDIIVDHDSNPAHDALYIATDVGVFACPNPTAATPCANWTVIGDGLPNSPVLGLTLRRNSRILRAATHGRSTWDIQLTDVSPPNLAFISSMTPAYAKAGAASAGITLNGGNFSNNTQVQFASVTTGVTTSFVSTTQLNVTFSSTLLQNGGVFPITLLDSQGVDPGSALGTGGLPFTVENPSLDPLTMTPATAEAYTAVHLHFTAAAAEPFLPNSVIAFYNVPPVTNPPTAPTLQFQLPMILEQPTLSSGGAVYDLTTAITDLTTPGNYWVIPYNPAPGGAIDPIAINAPSFGLTGPVPFQFTLTPNPGPVIQVSSPLALSVSALGANTGTTYDFFQVTNLVGATLNITNATIGGTNAANFQFIPPATGTTSCNFESTKTVSLAPGVANSCFFGLEYTAGTPPGNAQSNATLNITDNASGSPQSFPITGLIAPNAGLLLLTPVNFGAVALGTTSPTMNATLENASSSPVNVTSAFSISGTNPADFHLVPFVPSADGLSACPTTLPFTLPAIGTPGFACDVSLNFTPSAAGNETAQLNVTASVAVTTSTPNLLGTGVELTSISPQVVATGGPAFTLVVNGGGFASSAVVNVAVPGGSPSPRLTTFINSTQLQASIPASDIATAGSLAISVTSPSPGGTTSEPKTLIVAQATEANNDNINFARTPNFGTTTLRTASGSFSGGTTGVTLNWSSAFPDTNYTAICSAETTVGDFLLPIITLRTTTAITVVPTGGGTPSGNVACFAIPDSDTSDIRHGRTVYSGAPATITVTWNAAFPDTTYVTACTVETQGSTGGGFSSVISALATTSVTAINGGIAAGTMHCIGVPVTDRSAVRRSKTAVAGTPATVAVSFNTSFANTTAAGGNYAAVCSDVQLGVTGSDAALAISLGSRTDTGFTVINEIPSGTLHCLAVPLGDSAPVRFTEDTTQATAQLAASSGSPLTPPDPTPTVACAGSAAQLGRAKSVWWNWVAPANGTLIADSRFSSYTTVLSAWTLSTALPSTTETYTAVGCANGNLAAVAPFPAATLMTFNVTAGTTYYIMASDASTGGAGGTLTLNMDFASTDPANDDNATPTVIAAAPFTATENTIPATANTNTHSDSTPPAGCATGAASNGQANSVWFEYTPSSSGTIVADTLTSRYETILNVTSGSPTGTQVACNQSAQSGIAQSQVTFAATSGVQYFFMVSAFLGDGGTTNFHLNFSASSVGPATKLAFTQQPTNVVAGSSITPAVQVTIQDASGNTVTTATNTINVAILNNAGGGTLSGTLSASPTNGVATFSNLSINKVGTGYTLTATASPALTAANSSAFNVTAGAAATVTATSGSGQSATISTAFAAPLVATVTDSGGNPVNSVVVTFTPPGSGPSGTFAGGVNTATTNASGVATSAIYTANSIAGVQNVLASATGATSASFSLTNKAGAAAKVAVSSGSGQSATISTAFGSPLAALVTDSGGNPVNGVVVTFTAPASGASGTFAGGANTATTNGSGVATSATFTANSTAGGPYNVVASATGATSANFSLTNKTGAAAKVTATSGTPQSAAINTAFGAPLGATVTDSGGNPVSGVLVTFTPPASGASGTFAAGGNTGTTNASGVATSGIFTANSTAGGPYNVVASAAGATSANFALTNLSGTPAKVAVSSGSGQSATINAAFGAPLVALVTDASNNPVSGVVVTFTPPASGASGTFAGGVNTATTNTSGVATSAIFTANSTAGGPYNVVASVTGATSANFALTNTAGAAAKVAVSSGSGQSATINTPFLSPLTALVTDSGGNPVNGVVVTFTPPGSGASGTFAGGVNTATTNASGVATSAAFTANSKAGAYSVVASATGATSANFSLTNNAGAAATVTATSGSGQSATIGAAFAAPLVATVTDSGGNPVNGVVVTFTPPASGPSGTFAGGVNTATTNASGVATSAVFTANSIAGVCSVTASATGATSASFSLTIKAGAAAKVAVSSGSGQSATISTAFGSPLAALVTDSGGNPVNGVVVTFTPPASGASGTFAAGGNTGTTNGAGIATSGTFTANSKAGAYSVVASATGATSANFSLTNNAGAAAKVSATSGTPQSAAINTAFAAPLGATVTDSGGNPVSGVLVTFTPPASGASGTFAAGGNTGTTNASGVATSGIFTANSTVGGPYNVVASATGATSANFSLTNLSGTPAKVATTSGTPQSTAISSAFANPFVVTVTDASSNPVSGVVVTFTPPASGPSGTFAGGVNTATTNTSGVATSAVFTANSTAGGPYNVVASVTGATSATFVLTNTAGAAAKVAVSGGSGQSTTISTAFGSPLGALVTDSGGNPVNGVVVTFTPPASGASGTFAGGVNTATTNSSGVATSAVFTANSKAGAYSVVASATGATSANFALTNNAGAATTVTATSGSGQAAAINTAFTAPLAATVTDSGGNPVNGVVVTFTPPASGASGSFAAGGNTGTSNASGVATSGTFTANGTSGTYNVVASATGTTSANFSLTNNAGPAASITATSGTPQTVVIGTAFAVFKAVVKDSGGNLATGVAVTFTAPSSGASGTFANNTNTVTVNTDNTGTATATTFTANFTNGAFTVNATVSGVATPAAFSLTNTANAPTITTLVPASATAGGAAFTLTVNGTNFAATSVVSFNGAAATTTFVNGTQLTASIPATAIATAGTVNVSVSTPTPGGGTSGNASFTINNPVPTLTSISPTAGPLGQAVNLTLTGTGFVTGAVVTFGANADAGAVVSNGGATLKITIPAGQLATAGQVNVTVTDPAPGGGTTAAQTFTVQNVQPVLTTLSPTSTLAGGAAFTLTVNGNAGTFVQGAVVSFNGKTETTTFVNSGQLTAAITAPDIATAGNVNVIVTNPAPAVGPSAALTFAVNNPVPTITAATAAGQNHIAGGAAFTLTVTGTNFVTGTNEASVVSFNGKTETTTFVSGTQITAAIPASDAATAGTFNVSVSNPGPGGGPTPATVTFTIDGYTLSGPGSAVTVKAGTPATIPITITPTANGFANAVVFSVTGLPANSSLMALTVPNVTAKTTVNLTINTTARGAAPPVAPVDEPLPPAVRLLMVTWICALLAAAYAMILIRRRPQLRRYAALVPLALLLVSGVVLTGCASAMKGTPMGTSQLTVTATSGTLSQSTQATLTVQ